MQSTPFLGLPVPDDTDPISAGAQLLRDLGDALDGMVPKLTWGVATVTFQSGGGGNVQIDHHLGETPDIVLATQNIEALAVSCDSYNATSFSAHANELSDGNNAIGRTVDIFWIAYAFPTDNPGYFTTQTA